MPDSIVKFFDREMRPPRGGWLFPIGDDVVTRYSEDSILDELVKWQKNNSRFVSREESERQLWAYYCQREPERCGIIAGTPLAGVVIQPKAVTRELQGPPIWAYLNTFAVAWSEGLHGHFLATCNAIISILECAECQREWSRILLEFPPTALKTRLEVCRWVNMAHNEVNKRRGVSLYPYEKMIAEWGAPIA